MHIEHTLKQNSAMASKQKISANASVVLRYGMQHGQTEGGSRYSG